MNKIYRVVRRAVGGEAIVTSELTKRGKGVSVAVKSALASLVMVAGATHATDYTVTVTNTDLQPNDTITVSGDGVMGWVASSGVLTTRQAFGGNTITTHGNSAYGVEMTNNTNVILDGTAIVTTGTSSDPTTLEGSYGIGMQAGHVTMTGGSITTSGDVSPAIEMLVSGGVLVVDGATISVTGAGFSTAIPNAGIRSFQPNEDVSVLNTHIVTNNNLAHGVYLPESGTIGLTDDTITTLGDNSIGVVSGAQTSNLINTKVETFGSGSFGLSSVRNSAGILSFAGNTVTTHGAGADGAITSSGAVLNLTDATVHADSARGVVDGIETQSLGGTVSLTRSIVETGAQGGDAVVVNRSTGVFSSDAASRLITVANGAHGLTAALNAALSFDGTTHLLPQFSITGDDSAALHATSGGTIQLNSLTLDASTVTLGANSWGLLAENGGVLTLGGATVIDGLGIWARGTSSSNVGLIDIRDTSKVNNARVRVDDFGKINLDVLTDRTGFTIMSLEGVGSAGTGVVNMGTAAGGNEHNLTVNGANSTTYAGGFVGDGDLIRAGSGSLELTGAHGFDFNGHVEIQDSATLAIGGGAQAVDKTFQFFNPDAKLDISAVNSGTEVGVIQSQTSGDGHIELGAKDLTIKSATADSVFSGTITGTGSLIKDGASKLTLNGANVFNFTGDTHIVNGTLAVTGATTATGNNFVLDNAGTLDVSGVSTGNFDAGMLNGGGTILIGANSLTVDGAGSGTFGGTLSGSGDLIKTGTGTLKLDGIHAFDYTGETMIKNGVLVLSGLDPSTFTKTFTLDGGWLDLSDTPAGTTNDWSGVTVDQGANAANGGVIGANDDIDLGAAGIDETIAYQIGDGTPANDGVYVVKKGAGTTELTADNHYAGNTRIEGGILKVSTDGNLGDTSLEREVVLNGGNLEIAGSFISTRNVELRQNGSVIVDAGESTTLGALVQNGGDFTFTKDGDGSLIFAGGGSVGAIVADAGSLTLIGGAVDSSAIAGAKAVTLHNNGDATFTGGSITSADDAIVSDGTNTVTLNGTTVAAGAGHDLYRVAAGAGTLNANGTTLDGVLAVDAGATMNLNLDQGATYTGVVTRGAGSTLNMALNDSASTWNMTGNAEVDSLTNLGTIKFGAPVGTTYESLMVNGNYTGGGSVSMHTELNLGGDPANQHTDRLLIQGDATGTTTLDLDTTGSGDNTNIGNSHNKIPTEGISVVQVGGNANADSFKLRGGYVLSTPGSGGASPFQYRLFAYGPGQTAQSQSQLGAGSTLNWDYRVETAYIDDHGDVVPGVCTTLPPGSDPNTPCPGGGGDEHPLVAPQATTYLTVGPALQNYGVVVMEALNRRLGEMRVVGRTPSDGSAEFFARAIGDTGSYASSLSTKDFGFGFDQNISAMQVGGNLLNFGNGDSNLRLGLAVTTGTTDLKPKAPKVEFSRTTLKTRSLAATATWQNADGWYADGILSYGRYNGSINTDKYASAGRIDASSLDISLEAGRNVVMPSGVEVEPQLQILRQSVRVDGQTDADGIVVGFGTSNYLTMRAGVRVAVPAGLDKAWKPYVRTDLLHTWGGSNQVNLSDVAFDQGAIGSSVQIALGADGQLNKRLSVYGEIDGRHRIGGHGINSVGATLGMRYSF
jgi:outer membrane autotransporter protein